MVFECLYLIPTTSYLLYFNVLCKLIDPMGEIISRMPRKRSKRTLIERLLYLGIIDDKKQCRKKRSKKSGDKSKGSGDDGSSNGKVILNYFMTYYLFYTLPITYYNFR